MLEERAPARLILLRPLANAENLPITALVHANRNQQRDVAHLAGPAALELVDQKISEHRVAEGPTDERGHHRVSQGRVPLSQPKVRKILDTTWCLPSTRLRDLFDLGGRSAQRPRLSCLRQPRGHEITLLRVLTDRGSEFCGNPEQHEYDIDYSRSKTKSP